MTDFTQFENKTFHIILGWNRDFELQIGPKTFLLSHQSFNRKITPLTHDFDAREHCLTLKERADLLTAWTEIFREKDFLFPYRSYFELEDLCKIAAQKFSTQFGLPLGNALAALQTLPHSRLRFWISVPGPIRRTIATKGIPLVHGISSVLWGGFLVKRLFSGLWNNIKNGLRQVRYFLITQNAPTQDAYPKTFWISADDSFFPLNSKAKATETLNMIEFLEAKRIPCLRGQPIFLTNSNPKVQKLPRPPHIQIGRDLFLCPRENPIRFSDLVQGLLIQISLGANTLFGFFTGRWQDLLLADEYSQIPFTKTWFETVKPVTILYYMYNPSSAFCLSMRKRFECTLWRVFYGMNSYPIEDQGKKTGYLYPDNALMIEDQFAVWDAEQAHWLYQFGYPREKVQICGPLVFAHYPERRSSPVSGKIRIGVFDMIPFKPEFRFNLIGLGCDYYYDVRVIRLFFDDILRACREVFLGKLNVEIHHKPKRNLHHYHQKEYWDFIESLKSQSTADFSYIQHHPDKNPIQLNVECDATIHFPFCSTAGLSFHYGVPTSYYDPLNRVEGPFYTEQHPPLMHGYDQIKAWIEALLLQHIPQTRNAPFPDASP